MLRRHKKELARKKIQEDLNKVAVCHRCVQWFPTYQARNAHLISQRLDPDKKHKAA